MTCAGAGVEGRRPCGLICSRAVTGGGEGDVGFPLVTFVVVTGGLVVVTAGLPAGVVVGGVTAGSCAKDLACGSGPPAGGVDATGGLEAGVAAALAGAVVVVVVGAIAVFGWGCG